MLGVHALHILFEQPYAQLIDEPITPLASQITSVLPWQSVVLGVHALHVVFEQPEVQTVDDDTSPLALQTTTLLP